MIWYFILKVNAFYKNMNSDMEYETLEYLKTKPNIVDQYVMENCSVEKVKHWYYELLRKANKPQRSNFVDIQVEGVDCTSESQPVIQGAYNSSYSNQNVTVEYSADLQTSVSPHFPLQPYTLIQSELLKATTKGVADKTLILSDLTKTIRERRSSSIYSQSVQSGQPFKGHAAESGRLISWEFAPKKAADKVITSEASVNANHVLAHSFKNGDGETIGRRIIWHPS
ncbi:unnamed protein product [Trichobilharzia regenti]|nr:unnamed protein product [Trichobilharzia regenti]